MSKPDTIRRMEQEIIEERNRKYAVILNTQVQNVWAYGQRTRKLMDNLTEILQQKATFKNKEEREFVVEGTDTPVTGIRNIFETKEFKGHPFDEVSRNMENAFKMYCLVNGVEDEEMLSLTGDNPPEAVVSKIASMKDSFFRMIADKDMDAMAEWYVGIAEYMEKKISGLRECDDITKLSGNFDNLTLLVGSISYLSQTLNLGAKAMTGDQIRLVDMIDRGLKEKGKNYTFRELEDTMYATAYGTDKAVKLYAQVSAFTYDDLLDDIGEKFGDDPNNITGDLAERLLQLSYALRAQKAAAEMSKNSRNAFINIKIGAKWLGVSVMGEEPVLGYRDIPVPELLAENAKQAEIGSDAVLEELNNNQVRGWFGRKDNPEEFDELKEAMEAAHQADLAAEEERKTGLVSIKTYAACEEAHKQAMKAAQRYLDAFEPGSGDEARRYKLVVHARMNERDSLEKLHNDPVFQTIKTRREHASALLSESAHIRVMNNKLETELRQILSEPYSHTDSNGRETKIEGSASDEKKGTLSCYDAFSQPEFHGHPFNEAGRNTESHFKAYCISRGMTEDQLMVLATPDAEIPDQLKEQLRGWKKDFFDMILEKNLDKISDMYVSLAEKVEADRDRFAALKPGNAEYVRNDQVFLLKYSGQQSWYSQSVNHGGPTETDDQKVMVSLVDRKLRERGRSYGFGNLRLPLYALDNLAANRVTQEADEFVDDSLENPVTPKYKDIAAGLAVLQDYMHAQPANLPDKSWLTGMPENFETISQRVIFHRDKPLDDHLAEEEYYADLPEIAEMPQVIEEGAPQAEEEAVGQPEAFMEADEADYERYPELDEIESLYVSQGVYLELFRRAQVPYPAEGILKILKDETKVQLHKEAAEGLRRLDEARTRLKAQYDGKISDNRFARFYTYFLDPADTPEAREKNDAFIREINTQEGAEAFANRLCKNLLETDLSDVIPTDIEDMTRKYLKAPEKYEFLWACNDILSMSGALSEIKEPVLSALQAKIPVLQTASSFINAAKLTAADGWAAYIQPGLTTDDMLQLEMAGTLMRPELTANQAPEADEFNDLAGSFLFVQESLKQAAAMKKMQDAGLLDENLTLELDGDKVSPNKMIEKAADDASVLDRIVVIPEAGDHKEAMKTAVSELPLTAEEVKGLAEYKAMLDYHRRAYESAGVQLPTAEHLKNMLEEPAGRDIHNRAKAFYVKYQEDQERAREQYSNTWKSTEVMSRLWSFMLDASETAEAAGKNRALMGAVSTPEGQKKLIEFYVKELMSKPDDFFLAGSIQEAADKYMKDPLIYEIAWAAHDISQLMTAQDNPIQLEQPLHDAFLKKSVFFQQGGAFKAAAEIMSRDDWALFMHPEFRDELKGFTAASGYAKNDPYRSVPRDKGRQKIQPAQLFGAVAGALAETVSASGLTAQEKHALFSNGAEITAGGKSLTQNEALVYIRTHGLEGLDFHADEEKNKKIAGQLKELDADYLRAGAPLDALRKNDRREKSTAGRALHRDMRALYEDLDGVNHGAFISSGEFDNVIRTVKKLADQPHRPEEVETRLKQIVDFADVYLDKKRSRRDAGDLDQHELKRYNAVLTVKTECNDRLKTIEKRHVTAEAIHNAFNRQPEESRNDHLKTQDQMYDEETARMPEGHAKLARQLVAKYRSTPEKVASAREFEGNFIEHLPEADILKRIEDDHIRDLHDRAKKAFEKHRFYTTMDEKLKCGNGDPQISRICKYFMDFSDTPEAKEHNRLIAAAISTPEGCKALYSRMAHDVVTSDDLKKLMCAATLEDYLKIYEDNPRVCEFAYSTPDINEFAGHLEEPLRSAFKDRAEAVQIAINATTAIGYMASDMFLAYPPLKLGDDVEKWKDLDHTMIALSPEDHRTVGHQLTFLAQNPGMGTVMKHLNSRTMLNYNWRFYDERGKHITLQRASEKLLRNEQIHARRLTDESEKKIEKQLHEIDTADPLDIGRGVLDGSYKGVSGCPTNESYHEQIAVLQEMVNAAKDKNPSVNIPALDDMTKLLKEAQEAQPQDPGAICRQYRELTEKVTEIRKKSGAGVLNDCILKLNLCANLAENAEAHRTYMASLEKEESSWLKDFSDDYLSDEAEAPQTLRDIAKKGLEDLKNCEGMDYDKLPEDKKQRIAKGTAAVLLVNQIRREKVLQVSKKAGSVTDLLSKNTDPIDSVCEIMALSPIIRKDCGIIIKSRDNMRRVLTTSGRMDDMFREYVASKSVQSLVDEIYNENEELKEEAKSLAAGEPREDSEAFGKYYAKPAHDACVAEQKLLGEMLNHPKEYSVYEKRAKNETKAQAAGRVYTDRIRTCLSRMIAARQIEDFVRKNHDALGNDNISRLCSEQGIRDRAEQIQASDTLKRMTSSFSTLMTPRALSMLAIGAENLVNRDEKISEGPTENSERLLTEVVKRYAAMEDKVKPLDMENFRADQVKQSQPQLNQ